jgi:hypothetical protein
MKSKNYEAPHYAIFFVLLLSVRSKYFSYHFVFRCHLSVCSSHTVSQQVDSEVINPSRSRILISRCSPQPKFFKPFNAMMHCFDKKLIFRVFFVQNLWNKRQIKKYKLFSLHSFYPISTKVMHYITYKMITCCLFWMHVSFFWNNSCFQNKDWTTLHRIWKG